MTKEPLKKILESLKLRLEKFSKSFSRSIKSYRSDLNELSKITTKIQESSSGSWIGFHSRLYYKGYKKPKWDESFDSEWGSLHGIPETWEEKTYDDVSSFIKTHSKGKDILDIQRSLTREVEAAKKLQQKVCTELSLVRNLKNYSKEIEILEKIENIKWGLSSNEIIRGYTPRHHMSRDTLAVSQGVFTPPHIEYYAKVLYCFSVISDIENFINLSQRLIRQIEIKQNLEQQGREVEDSISNVLCICKRFHVVARQLRNRHNNRQTLEIDNEYDVQDLFHSLLKVYFDDVRPEEWTPAYAGGSSKMDFLLKKEKIAIEVKKTRKNLTDKQIGEQLLIDIAKYRQCSDCKTLICFIYDPEGKIGNPRGLENDLNQLSDDDINIITIIEPS